MARRIPPFASIRAFEAAARHGNFRRAGDELGLSVSAISHQIKSLEEFLSAPLFSRSGNIMALTSVGKLYLADLTEALDQLDKATARVEERKQGTQLTINMFPSLAGLWLLPRLNTYRQLEPNVDVRVITTFVPIDFRAEATDLGVRYAAAPPAEFRSDILFVEEMFPVCSSSYLGGRRSLNAKSDMSSETLIRCSTAAEEWEEWFEAIKFTGKRPRRKIDFDSRALALEAAADGIGIAMGRTPYVDRALEAKRLLRPFSQKLTTGQSYYLVMPERSHRQKSAIGFRNWLITEARQGAASAAAVQTSRDSRRSSKG